MPHLVGWFSWMYDDASGWLIHLNVWLCIWLVDSFECMMMHLVGWFIWMYDDASGWVIHLNVWWYVWLVDSFECVKMYGPTNPNMYVLHCCTETLQLKFLLFLRLQIILLLQMKAETFNLCLEYMIVTDNE